MNNHTTDGILILGTRAGCGKTVVTAGLAAALGNTGFQVQAFKPLIFGQIKGLEYNLEQAFLQKIVPQYVAMETIQVVSPWDFPAPLWNKLLENCKSFQYPCLLEAPGSIATPWRIHSHQTTDALAVAESLGLRVLLVGNNGPSFLEEMQLALTFLQSRQMSTVGFIRTHITAHQPESLFSDAETLLLSQHFATPFLGDLPYSPSISVSGLQQGNLIRLTLDHIDLLPLQMGIGLTL